MRYAFDCGNTHQWNDGKITKAATCKYEGTKLYTCATCGELKTEAIPMLTEHKPGKSATATKDQVCTVCKKVLVPATGETDPTVPGNAEPARKALSTTAVVVISVASTLLVVGIVIGAIVLWLKKR